MKTSCNWSGARSAEEPMLTCNLKSKRERRQAARPNIQEPNGVKMEYFFEIQFKILVSSNFCTLVVLLVTNADHGL